MSIPEEGQSKSGGYRLGPGEQPDLAVHIAAAHQGFAHENGIGAPPEHLSGVLGGPDAALTDKHQAVGDFFAELLGGVQVDFEGFQVAVVDADDAGLSFEGPVEFFLVVNFHQDVELEGVGDSQKDTKSSCDRQATMRRMASAPATTAS